MALAGKFNGDTANTDNYHPLWLLLEIEEAIPVDAKRPLGSPRPKGYISYPWPDHQNGLLECTGREGEGRLAWRVG